MLISLARSGENDFAIEFDKTYLLERPFLSDEIANKWSERGYPEIAEEFKIILPNE